MKGCDVVGLRGEAAEVLVIGELKAAFTLELVLQAVERTAVADEVWLAVAASKRGRGREADPRVKKLCRFLGFGLLAVTASEMIEVIVEPAPWTPRRNSKRRSAIVDEFRRRKGDPVAGGSTRMPQMTAYRPAGARHCCRACRRTGAAARSQDGRSRRRQDSAGQRLRLFERLERGVYGLTDGGRAALVTFAAYLPQTDPV